MVTAALLIAAGCSKDGRNTNECECGRRLSQTQKPLEQATSAATLPKPTPVAEAVIKKMNPIQAPQATLARAVAGDQSKQLASLLIGILANAASTAKVEVTVVAPSSRPDPEAEIKAMHLVAFDLLVQEYFLRGSPGQPTIRDWADHSRMTPVIREGRVVITILMKGSHGEIEKMEPTLDLQPAQALRIISVKNRPRVPALLEFEKQARKAVEDEEERDRKERQKGRTNAPWMLYYYIDELTLPRRS